MDAIVEKKMDFRRITLSIQGSMASTTEYELVRKAGGCEASLYRGGWKFNKLTTRLMCRESHRRLDKAEYERLAKEFMRLGVPSWNGFSGNDSDVLDGEMFSLEIVLEDGSVISAYGTNAYPENYHEFEVLIREAACGAN